MDARSALERQSGDGAPVLKPSQQVTRSFADDVIFHESGPPSGWPLAHILDNLNRMTRETVEGFADWFW